MSQLDEAESAIRGELVLRSERLRLRKKYRELRDKYKPSLGDKRQARLMLQRIEAITRTLERYAGEIN